MMIGTLKMNKALDI